MKVEGTSGKTEFKKKKSSLPHHFIITTILWEAHVMLVNAAVVTAEMDERLESPSFENSVEAFILY